MKQKRLILMTGTTGEEIKHSYAYRDKAFILVYDFCQIELDDDCACPDKAFNVKYSNLPPTDVFSQVPTLHTTSFPNNHHLVFTPYEPGRPSDLRPPPALARNRSLVDTYPCLPPAWGRRAVHGLDRERWDLVREALPHVSSHPYARFLEAALGPLVEGPPEGADPEARLGWEAHRLFRGHGSSPSVWAAWRDCPNQVMRLELGLQVLERVPEERSALRLLALQTIADRADSSRHQRRLAALWPRPDSNEDPAPTLLFKDWLAGRETPTWIAWEEEGQVHSLGTGEAPPEGALSRLAKDGTLPPILHGGWVWRGHPLIWEGCPVGSVLLAQPAEQPPRSPLEPGAEPRPPR